MRDTALPGRTERPPVVAVMSQRRADARGCRKLWSGGDRRAGNVGSPCTGHKKSQKNQKTKTKTAQMFLRLLPQWKEKK